MVASAGWLLAGCSSMSSMNPVNWWHRQEGGEIAKQRPAPPNADQPYPNISTVPAKPEPPDADALKKLTDSLVADRTNAQHAAERAPLADPSSPSASPHLFGVGTAPPPPPPGAILPTTTGPTTTGSSAVPVASASMPAVTAPPPPAAPPSAAPRKAVQSTPLAPATPADETAKAPPGTVISAGTPPAFPAGPPARPAAAGTPPVAPVMPALMPTSLAGPSATIVFPEKTSALSQPAADEVKAFAAKRGQATIEVTGYGDAASSDPETQSAALNLGLSRAQSIVDELKAAGVPGTAIRVSAEASGRGASLHLLQ